VGGPQQSVHPVSETPATTGVYVATGATGDDVTYYVLTPSQYQEVEREAAANGNSYTEGTNIVVERHNLYQGKRFSTLKKLLAHLKTNNLQVIDDYTYVDY
jgi:hypothetical protein